jgi:hypothetical protein
MSAMLPRFVIGNDSRKLWSGTNQAQIAQNDIKKLRKLIETAGAEPTTESGYSGVLSRLVRLASIFSNPLQPGLTAVWLHRPELPQSKNSAISADSVLAKKYWRAHRYPNRQPDDNVQRNAQEQRYEANGSIDDRLEPIRINPSRRSEKPRGVHQRRESRSRTGQVDCDAINCTLRGVRGLNFFRNHPLLPALQTIGYTPRNREGNRSRLNGSEPTPIPACPSSTY